MKGNLLHSIKDISDQAVSGMDAAVCRNITIDFDTCMNHPKKLTSDFHRLDVRELAREGFMKSGYTFPWRLGSGVVVHIEVAYDERIYLRRGSFVQTICTQQSKCHFGGERLANRLCLSRRPIQPRNSFKEPKRLCFSTLKRDGISPSLQRRSLRGLCISPLKWV